jgi:pyruvate dehydrogenase E2 component (dihydrolipoamide acetyltransferase)
MGELTVRMPALSATMEDAELLGWLVAIGDEVRSGQPIAEVTTDKVDMELESPYDGTVAALLAEPGTRVELGAPVATLTSDEDDLLGDLDLGGGAPAGASVGADADDAQGGADSDTEVATPTEAGPADAAEGPGAEGRGRRIPAAHPPVRKRAKQLGVDLADVTPTGNRGHVTHKDLDRYLESTGAGGGRPAGQPVSAAAAPAGPAADRSPSAPSPTAPTAARDGASGRRRAIRLATARTTTRSAAIPQVTLHRRIDVTWARERRDGRTWTTELARALAAALWRHPECNATWDEEANEPVPLPGVRIGVAVDTPDGLVVVGVDDPDADDPAAADARVRSAVARARDGKLTADDTRELSTTISNLGGFGIDRFDALLLPPQPTILSVGRMVDVPVVVDGHVRVRPMMDVGLTVDHRVADGADGARLLDTFARRLEG